MEAINTSIEQNLWLEYYKKYLEGNDKSAKGAADKADEILKEFKIRNKYVDNYDD